MAELTGLFGIDWVVVFLVAFGASVLVMSWRRDIHGLRVAGSLVIPFVCGVVMLGAVGVLFPDNIGRILAFVRRPVTAIATVAVGVTGVAVADLVFTRFVRPVARRFVRPLRERSGDLVVAAVIGGVTLVAVLGMVRVGGAVHVGAPVADVGPPLEVTASYPLPGSPMGLAFRGELDGYVSLAPGQVARFEFPDGGGGPPRLSTVADGFTYVRGLTIVGDVLVVGDLGPMPCPDPFPACKGQHVPGVDLIEGERRILEESRARLIAYDIGPDGSLSNERMIVDDLPVAGSDHGLNGLVTGADGLIYVAVGGLGDLPFEMLEDVDHPNLEFLGTVLRVSDDGDDVEVFASGLRNVYGLAFDERGDLWGIDNDGETLHGWRAEEILQIRQGGEYGFPHEGSYGQPVIRDDWPIWHAEGVGSAAVRWRGDVGAGPGLLIGSCGHLDQVELTDHDGEWRVAHPSDYQRVVDLPGCVTDIEPLGRGGEYGIVVSVFGADALYVLGERPDG